MGVECATGISAIYSKYDGFIFDLWGVVHDGSRLFPGVIKTFKELKKAGKKIVLLSNSPQKSSDNIAHLETLGIAPNMYDGIITSGEIALEYFKKQLINEWGKDYLCLGSGRYASFLYEAGGRVVFDEQDANFVLNGDVIWSYEELECYGSLFERCIECNLPMLCTNPDERVYVGSSPIICSGTLAKKYEDMGGKVRYFGKPYIEAYEQCLDIIGSRNILAIGDNMETDIKGACDFKIDSLLIKQGVHRESFINNGEDSFFKSYTYFPNYMIEEVLW